MVHATSYHHEGRPHLVFLQTQQRSSLAIPPLLPHSKTRNPELWMTGKITTRSRLRLYT